LLSPWHLVVLGLVVLLVFGPSRLPEIGRSLGRGMREFRDSFTASSPDDQARPLEPPAPSADRRRDTVG
jgi:sec-independent protein translocase protein TatA